MYAVEFLPSAARDLARLDGAVRRRIAKAVDRLAIDPHLPGTVKLRGSENVWRLRVGDYRVLYAVESDRLVVLVIKIGHRRDVYR